MKRLFDVAVSLLGLLFLWPLLLILALCVRHQLGRPAIFQQQRPGLNGHVFTLYKFRSMRDLNDVHGNPLSDAARLTPFGRRLRATSLDELPELWNVLRGDMSLVGPRPLLVSYLPRYSKEQARRHEVRPGLTGWAQINGRNAITWQQRFELDVWYVDNRSFWLDLRILCLTAVKVMKKEGVQADGQATVSEFLGNSVCDSSHQPDDHV